MSDLLNISTRKSTSVELANTLAVDGASPVVERSLKVQEHEIIDLTIAF